MEDDELPANLLPITDPYIAYLLGDEDEYWENPDDPYSDVNPFPVKTLSLNYSDSATIDKIRAVGPYRLADGQYRQARLEWIDGVSRPNLDKLIEDVFEPFEPFGYREAASTKFLQGVGGGRSIPDAQFLGKARQRYPGLILLSERSLFDDYRDRELSELVVARDAALLQLERCAERLYTAEGRGPLPEIKSVLKVWLAECRVAGWDDKQFDEAKKYAGVLWNAMLSGWRGYDPVWRHVPEAVKKFKDLDTPEALIKVTVYGLLYHIAERDLILEEAQPFEIHRAVTELAIHLKMSGQELNEYFSHDPKDHFHILDDRKGWHRFLRPIMYWLEELRNPIAALSYAQAADEIAQRLQRKYSKEIADAGLNSDDFSERRLYDVRIKAVQVYGYSRL